MWFWLVSLVQQRAAASTQSVLCQWPRQSGGPSGSVRRRFGPARPTSGPEPRSRSRPRPRPRSGPRPTDASRSSNATRSRQNPTLPHTRRNTRSTPTTTPHLSELGPVHSFWLTKKLVPPSATPRNRQTGLR